MSVCLSPPCLFPTRKQGDILPPALRLAHVWAGRSDYELLETIAAFVSVVDVVLSYAVMCSAAAVGLQNYGRFSADVLMTNLCVCGVH